MRTTGGARNAYDRDDATVRMRYALDRLELPVVGGQISFSTAS